MRIELTEDGGKPTGEVVPKGNDRMWAITLVNFRRGRREQHGTATIYRLAAIFAAVGKRHPDSVKSSPHPRDADKPIRVWLRRGGPLVLTVTPLEGPVASVRQ